MVEIRTNWLINRALWSALTFVGAVSFVLAQTPDPPLVPPKPIFISRDDAVQLALTQASAFRESKLNEQIAAEDVFQAGKAFLPKVTVNPSLIYNTPTSASILAGTPRPPSFLGSNAVAEIQGLVTVSGEIDTSGRLQANRRRARILLEAARAGTEVSRRNLINATDEAYLALALASAQRDSAEADLKSAEQFESLTKLLVDGGEIAPVDLMRAQIQTNSRRDELEQARVAEHIAADNLKTFLGYEVSREIAVSELTTLIPVPDELAQYSADQIADRPELRQIKAETEAANEDAKIARAERKPQLTYSIDGGFISDSLRPSTVGQSTGIRASVGVSIPVLDWGVSRSRQKQADLRAQISENSRIFAERQFAAQFDSNMAQARSAASRIRTLADNLRNAVKVLETSVLRYRAGETQIIEVTDAQTLIIAQRRALLQAIYDYRIAVARLKLATGK